MVANELLHNENIPRMVYEAYEVVLAEMGILASKAEQNYISALLTVTELMHLSIETPTPPPPRSYVGQCGGFLWYLKAWLARGGGGFLRICLAYSWKSMEVGERGGDLTRA